jgi:hypothetical protein
MNQGTIAFTRLSELATHSFSPDTSDSFVQQKKPLDAYLCVSKDMCRNNETSKETSNADDTRRPNG